MTRKLPFLPLLLFTLILLLASQACGAGDPASLDATLASRGAPNRAQATLPATTPEIPTRTQQPADPPTATPTLQPTPGLGVDPNLLNGLKIQFWQPWSGETNRELKALIEQYNLTNDLGIQVEMTSFGSQEALDQAMQAAIADGKPPDLTAAYLFQALNWQAGEGFVDLQPYLNDPDSGLSIEELADFYSSFFNAGQVGNEQLGLPAIGSAQVLVYNQTWAEELGFNSPPETPEELAKQACAAAQANKLDDNPENDGKGGLILSTHYSPIFAWITAFGGEIYNPANEGGNDKSYHFASEQVESAFSFLRDLYDRGCAWLPEEPYPEDGFANRLGLFAVNSVVNLPYQAGALQKAGSQDRWTVLPFPTREGGAALSVYGPAFEIMQSTPEKQLAAWMLIRYLLAPENQARLVQASNGLPVRKDTLSFLKEYQAAQTDWTAAQQLSANALSEPTAASWKTVRWALSDAATQLFRAYFTSDKIPELVKFLDKTAAELHRDAP